MTRLSKAGGERLLFALTVFLGALLGFLVQPLLGKRLLPWFGGVPSIWTACLLFFQTALLAGYAYAHLLSRRSTRHQAMVHGALLLVALGVLGVHAGAWSSPITPASPGAGEGTPIVRVLALLAASVGLPYALLTATSPLLMRWWSLGNRSASSTYRLYGLSNAGSLTGLLAYPLAVEPWLALPAQGWAWSAAFGLFAVACVACGTLAARSEAPEVRVATTERPPLPRVATWVALAALPCAALLSVTNQLCQEVAVVPFLWVLPLTIYLLTLILCFGSERWARPFPWAVALLLCPLASRVLLGDALWHRFVWQLVVLCLLLLGVAMLAHAELARRRPQPEHLTAYTLAIAAGGALAGVAVAIVAPVVFPAFWELHVTLALALLLAVLVLVRDADEGSGWLLALALVAAIAPEFDRAASLPAPLRHPATVVVAGLLLAGLAFALRRVTVPAPVLAGALAVLLASLANVLAGDVRDHVAGSVRLSRSFFGTLRVLEHDPNDPVLHRHELRHGSTTHGYQLLSAERRAIATSYYTDGSGVEKAFAAVRARNAGAGASVGLVGLGVGTVLAHTRAGDTVRVYELDPYVMALSRERRPLFTYLRDARSEVTVVLGDARLSLERELAEGRPAGFHLLVLDAFSSDSIPAHLLTEEAIRLYLAHLRGDGLLAVHISNRHLDLAPVVRSAADRFELDSVLWNASKTVPWSENSIWMILTRGPVPAGSALAGGEKHSADPRRLRWTDTRSDLLRVLRAK